MAHANQVSLSAEFIANVRNVVRTKWTFWSWLISPNFSDFIQHLYDNTFFNEVKEENLHKDLILIYILKAEKKIHNENIFFQPD